jgi:hypothetical protein
MEKPLWFFQNKKARLGGHPKRAFVYNQYAPSTCCKVITGFKGCQQGSDDPRLQGGAF